MVPFVVCTIETRRLAMPNTLGFGWFSADIKIRHKEFHQMSGETRNVITVNFMLKELPSSQMT